MKRQLCLSLLVLGLVLSPVRAAEESAQHATDGSTPPTNGSSSTSTVSPKPSAAAAPPANPIITSPSPSGSTASSNSSTMTTDQNTTTTVSTSTVGVSQTMTSLPESSTAESNETEITSPPSTGINRNTTTTVANTSPADSSSVSITTTTERVTTVGNTTIVNTAASTTTTVIATTGSVNTTTIAVSTAPTTTVVPKYSDVMISETNLLLATENLFVELKGAENESLTGLTLVVFDGSSATQKKKMDCKGKVFNASGILVLQINNAGDFALLKVVVVALYPTDSYNSSVPAKGLVDFAILSTDPSAQLDAGFNETMLYQDQPLVVITGTGLNMSLSLSRCREGQKDVGKFVVSAESRGDPNPCNMTSSTKNYTLQLHREKDNCKPLEAGQSQNLSLMNQLVQEINKLCRCGLTTWLLNGHLSCARDLYLDFSIRESYQGQGSRVIAAFTNFTKDNESLMVDKLTYSVVSCTSNCRSKGPHHQPDRANTSVTVAVVLSCVAVFLIILVSVILYMRSKRRGIIRQFRMTRLQEDDDMDDMEDFIGGGASFSAK